MESSAEVGTRTPGRRFSCFFASVTSILSECENLTAVVPSLLTPRTAHLSSKLYNIFQIYKASCVRYALSFVCRKSKADGQQVTKKVVEGTRRDDSKTTASCGSYRASKALHESSRQPPPSMGVNNNSPVVIYTRVVT